MKESGKSVALGEAIGGCREFLPLRRDLNPFMTMVFSAAANSDHFPVSVATILERAAKSMVTVDVETQAVDVCCLLCGTAEVLWRTAKRETAEDKLTISTIWSGSRLVGVCFVLAWKSCKSGWISPTGLWDAIDMRQ